MANTWTAGYKMHVPTKEGVRIAHVEIDVRSAECPKSVLLRQPEAAELIQIAGHAQASGVDALGPANQWPGAFYDAMTIVSQQRLTDENAQRRAVEKI